MSVLYALTVDSEEERTSLEEALLRHRNGVNAADTDDNVFALFDAD